MKIHRWALSRAALSLTLAGMLAACAVGPDFKTPASPADVRYTRESQATRTMEADGKAQRFVGGKGLPKDWWHLFKSEDLNRTVEAALANNPGLDLARARLSQSQNDMRAGYGLFYSRVEANLAGSRERTAPALDDSTAPGSVFNLVTLSGNIGYALDLFGGERRTVEALKAQSDYQYYASQAAYVSLSANVVSTCIARAAYVAQIRTTWEIIELDMQQLDAASAQADSGIGNYAVVLAMRSQLAEHRSELAALQQKRDQSDHLLATLMGSSPSHADLPDIDLDEIHLPEDVPVTLPSQLVRLRPDILQTEEQLHAASANVGVTTAALFPSFSLNGNFGILGKSFGNLSPETGKFWSMGPSLTVPLFQGGSLWYGRKAAFDALHQSEANYRQTVLAAFAQVADCLKALEHDAQQLESQVEMQRAARANLHLARANFEAGLIAEMDVLAAEAQFQEQTIAYQQAMAIREQDTVALFMALGGGWQDRPASELAGHSP